MNSAEGATQCIGSPSIPHILFIKLNAMPAKQLAIFFLKSTSAMVLFLFLHVIQHGFELTWAY